MTKESDKVALYRKDLARIHVEGYGFHWSGAADAVLDWFQRQGISSGRVVDLGCGGGQWLARLIDERYEATGIDVSPSMIELARQQAPDAELICGSFADIRIPACHAATSLGEPLNYLKSGPAMRRTMRHVFEALQPGGMFVFDVRHPAQRPVAPREHHRYEEDWFCHARIEERGNQLIRFITSFYRESGDLFRREEEVHRLRVFSRQEVARWLRKIGFRVRTYRAYGDYMLGERQSVFVCRKPT